MKIFLAWDGSTYAFEKYRPPYILLSFEALGRRGREVFQKFREKAKIVMLDSGAFTFIHSLGTAAFTLLRKMLFDSVDASTWIINVYYGALLKVDIPNGTLKRITSRTFGLEHAKPNKEKIADHAMRRWLYLVKKLDTDDWDFLNWYNKKEGC